MSAEDYVPKEAKAKLKFLPDEDRDLFETYVKERREGIERLLATRGQAPLEPLEPALTFEVSQAQLERAQRFETQQAALTGRLGSGLTWTFRQGPIGTAVRVTHDGGASLDVTEYERW